MDRQENPIIFAAVAEELLEKGDAAAAVRICQIGLKDYPDYMLGRRVLAEAFLQSDDLQSAKAEIDKGLSKFPDYPALLKFKTIVETTETIADVSREFEEEMAETVADEEKSLHVDEKEDDGLAEDINEAISEEEIIDELTSGQMSAEEKSGESFLRLVNTIESNSESENPLRADNPALIPGVNFTPLRATRRLRSDDYTGVVPAFPDFYNPAELLPEDDDDEESYEDSSEIYATETMASILVNQGAYSQAVDIYKRLAEQYPDKADYYNDIISDISKKLND